MAPNYTLAWVLAEIPKRAVYGWLRDRGSCTPRVLATLYRSLR